MTALIERILGRPFMAPETGGEGGAVAETPAAETSAAEAPEGAAVEAAEGEEGEGQQAEEGTTQDEEDDLEFGFKKYRVPKSLKEDIVKWRASQTQRDEAIASERKALDEERISRREANEAITERKGLIAHANQMLKAYEQINWAQLELDNPQLAITKQREFGQWERYKNSLSSDVTQLEKRSVEEAQQAFAKRYRDAEAQLHKDIPSWESVKEKVGQYAARELSLSPQQLVYAVTMEPALGKLLHQAWRGSQLEAAQKAASAKKPAEEESEPIKPATRVVRGNAAATNGLSDRMPTDDWMKTRNKQVSARH